MKLSKNVILFFWLCSFYSHAQFSEPEVGFVKEEKYLYPITPGQPGSLAGNMGELRSTHFHSGVDIRTNNEIGFAVRASKSGYISRVAMSPSGYGNVIYIKHPDGNTSVYGHLDHFNDALAEYVLQEQYKQKTFAVDLALDKDQFKIKRGDTIAISGNTGSSGGPHLHFEIRDSNDHALNPLLFKFDEIKDVTPPIVEKVALVTLDGNSRINDKFGRFEFYAYRNGNDYTIASPILASGTIGVEVLAKDKFLPRDQFYGGVNYIDMYVNGKLQFKQSVEKINIEETRGIYTLMDYKVLKSTGKRFYKLYLDDGNSLPFYETINKGKILIDSIKETNVEIQLRDPFSNAVKVKFRFKPSTLTVQVKDLKAARETDIDIEENIMTVTCKPCLQSENTIDVYEHGENTTLDPSYYSLASSVYLIDLRKKLPDSVIVCGKSYVTNLKTTIPSGVDYKYYSDWADITFPVDALYDTLYMKAIVPERMDQVTTIGDRYIPLSKAVTISLKPPKDYTKDKRISVYRRLGGSNTYLGGEWINGRITFQTREFGDFVFMTDSTPPSIRPISINSFRARLKIRDELSGVMSYNATLDGEWLLMHYDAKSSTIWSEQKDKSKPLKGEFILEVTDNAGNIETFTANIQ